MDIGTVSAGALVLASAVYLGVRALRAWREGGSCGGCGSCGRPPRDMGTPLLTLERGRPSRRERPR